MSTCKTCGNQFDPLDSLNFEYCSSPCFSVRNVPKRRPGTFSGHQNRPDSRHRGGKAKATHKHSASELFDWGRALKLNAQTMRSLGYRLSPEQKARLSDHA